MRLTRTLKIAAALLATATLGVSAASALVDSPPEDVTPQSPVAAPKSDHIDQTVRDPEAGLDWAVRSYASTGGASCVEAGRVNDGNFGAVGADGSFDATPVHQGGTCGSLVDEPVLLAVNHYPATDRRAARTVLFGRAGSDVAEVEVTGPDGFPRRLVTGPEGGFVLALVGALAPTDLPVRLTLITGEQLTFEWR